MYIKSEAIKTLHISFEQKYLGVYNRLTNFQGLYEHATEVQCIEDVTEIQVNSENVEEVTNAEPTKSGTNTCIYLSRKSELKIPTTVSLEQK